MKKLIPLFLVLFLVAACGKDKDKCEDIECNFGTCVEGVCECDEGYEGEHCDIAVNQQFIGSWDLPCEGSITISLLGQTIDIPPFSSVIEVESNGTPSEIKLDFTIPLVNQEITLVGAISGSNIEFEEQTLIIPEDVVTTALDLAGVNLPITLGDLEIVITGVGEYNEVDEELLVDITIDGGLLLNGVVNCVGVKL